MDVLKHEWKYVITKQVICIFMYTCVPMHSHNYVYMMDTVLFAVCDHSLYHCLLGFMLDDRL